MRNNTSVRKNEQDFEKKIQYGDYITLAKLIKATTPDSARMRFKRKDAEAIEAMKKIVENRENFIENFSQESN